MKKIIALLLWWLPAIAFSQTGTDAIMIPKQNLCAGAMYTHSSWDNYWEGSLKRSNENLGTVTTQMYSVMANYGISDNLNVIAGLPYVKTNASAGTLHSMQGLQDLSLLAKYRPVKKKLGPGTISAFGLAGVSFPVSNYVADFLPLSIGMRSTNISLRAMGDYKVKNLFVTGSAAYVLRTNIKIDRDAYYTTSLHLTNTVEMPDVFTYNIRLGYRSSWLIAEAVLDNWRTLGGFDITRNNMPFPSNRMNVTTAGINLKYTFKKITGLELTGGANYAVAGRNVGQSKNFNAGFFYLMDFNRKKQEAPKAN